MNKLKYIAVAGVLAGAIGAVSNVAEGVALPVVGTMDLKCVATKAPQCIKKCTTTGSTIKYIGSATSSSMSFSCSDLDYSCAKNAGCFVTSSR
jgi:folate-dependent tRNA-U54 methylase TrmFO/GidA